MTLKSLSKTVAYGTLEMLTGGLGVTRTIGGEKIRFPLRWCRYYEPNYEPGTFCWLRQVCKPGATAFDIGAHIGLFSVVMARLVGPLGRVFSFEPTRLTRKVLEETVRLNNYGDIVEVRGEAVSMSSGETMFFDTGDEVSNANSLIQSDRSKIGITVETVSIDDFVATRKVNSVDCLKIDVEGAELEVLSGARETFQTFQPATHLALHPPVFQQSAATLSEIWDLLQHYRMSVWFANATVSKDWFCGQRNLFDVDLMRAND